MVEFRVLEEALHRGWGDDVMINAGDRDVAERNLSPCSLRAFESVTWNWDTRKSSTTDSGEPGFLAIPMLPRVTAGNPVFSIRIVHTEQFFLLLIFLSCDSVTDFANILASQSSPTLISYSTHF